MKKKILIGIVIVLMVLVSVVAFAENTQSAEGETAPTGEGATKNYNWKYYPDEKTKTAVTFTSTDNKERSVTIPTYLLPTAPDKLNAKFESDGAFIITVNTRGKGNQLDKGIWNITPLGEGEGYKYTLYDEENNEKQVFGLVQSGGNTILIDNLESGEGYILDAQGNEMKWLGKVGACNEEKNININCYSLKNPNQPIIFPKCEKKNNENTECRERSGLLTWLREDSCYYNGKQLQYDDDDKTCSLLTKNAAGEAEVLFVNKSSGKTTNVTFKCTKEAKSYSDCTCTTMEEGATKGNICDTATYNKVKSLKRTDDVKKGFTTGAEMASNVGQFIELGRNYGWWKTSEEFLIFENLFEKSVLLRSIFEPERAICELNVGISDLLTEGFLPTVDGKSGADIQVERYLFKKINITTGREKESYYRYKVTFDVNGAYILKYSPVDSSGKPIYEYKTSFTVYLDDTNITGKIELSNKETYSYGTMAVGHPLMIKSNKYFKKACIKFHDIDDLEANVQGYLRENNNEVCNDVEDAYVPSLSEIKMEREEEKEGGGGGGGGGEGGYSIPSVEVEV